MKFSKAIFLMICIACSNLQAMKPARRATQQSSARRTSAPRQTISRKEQEAIQQAILLSRQEMARQRIPAKDDLQRAIQLSLEEMNKQKTSTQHAARPTQTARAPISDIRLPRTLQTLPGVAIRHIMVTRQGPSQCGSRAVANALATQDLIHAATPLTSANIQARAHAYNHILINHVIDDQEVRNIARTNHLMNAHIMSRRPAQQHEKSSPFIMQSIATYSHSLDEFVESMLTRQTITTNIICNTGGHWVLITIVKQEGKIPQILYMDSCNSPLSDSSFATSCIKYLHQIAFL